MTKWIEFAEKDSSMKFIEQLNWITKNQVSDLANVWYDAERYFLARRKLEELLKMQEALKNDIQELERDLADTKKEKTKPSGFTSDYMRTTNYLIRQMRHAETEIAATISYLSEIPNCAVPDWFIEFIKNVIYHSDSLEVKKSDEWQPIIEPSKASWWKKK